MFCTYTLEESENVQCTLEMMINLSKVTEVLTVRG